MIRFISLITLAFCLNACGSNNVGDGASVSNSVKQIVLARTAKASGKVPAKQVDLPKAPTILISIPNAGIRELAFEVNKSDGYRTFRSEMNRSYTFNNGHLTATRGLRFDLMSRDLQAGERAYRFLSAENQIGTLRAKCEQDYKGADSYKLSDIEFSGNLTEEICRTSITNFKTRIWRDPNGKAKKSQQWISPQMGFSVIHWVK